MIPVLFVADLLCGSSAFRARPAEQGCQLDGKPEAIGTSLAADIDTRLAEPRIFGVRRAYELGSC